MYELDEKKYLPLLFIIPILVVVFLFNLYWKRKKQQEFGDLEINRSQFTVKYKGEQIILAKKEFELLYFLANNPNVVYSRDELLHNIWGSDVFVLARTVDVHIRKVREKIGEEYITTVKGVGYKFEIG